MVTGSGQATALCNLSFYTPTITQSLPPPSVWPTGAYQASLPSQPMPLLLPPGHPYPQSLYPGFQPAPVLLPPPARVPPLLQKVRSSLGRAWLNALPTPLLHRASCDSRLGIRQVQHPTEAPPASSKRPALDDGDDADDFLGSGPALTYVTPDRGELHVHRRVGCCGG